MAMRIDTLSIEGLFRLVPTPVRDHRGFFARCFSRSALAAHSLVTDFPEWSLSHNARRNTVRGLHWQAAPHQEVKVIQCIRGAVFDVAVDVRPHSPTFGKWHAEELTADNRTLFYIPAGFAHGFQTLTDDTELLYHISEPFRPEGSRGVRWDDPDVGIAWPDDDNDVVLSERDASLPFLRDLGPPA